MFIRCSGCGKKLGPDALKGTTAQHYCKECQRVYPRA